MRLRFLVLCLLVLTAASYGQSPSKILGSANKALGGEKVLKAVKSWQLTGRITRKSDGASGSYTAAAGDSGRYATMFDLNGFEFASGYNGKSAWSRDSRAGLQTLTGEASRDFQAEAAYRNNRWLRAKDEKSKITPGGTADVNGRPANFLIVNNAKGARIKLFFDQASGLLIREEMSQAAAVKSFDYSDYRKIDGILTPFLMKTDLSGDSYEIKLDTVTYNRSLNPSIFDFPKVSGEAILDIPTLLNEVRANADRVDELLENYSYTQTRIERDLKSTGELVEKDSEKTSLTFYKGYRISRTIEKNGRPLSPGDQAKEDREAEKQVAEIEERVAERERKKIASRDTTSGRLGQPTGERQRFTIAEAVKGSLLLNPRRERFRSREVIVFDYEPDPAFKPKTRNEKLFALCSGAVWVDAATKQVVRLEASLTKSMGNFLAKAQRGASFTLENELVNNEIWLPARADINFSVKILFAGININQLIKYGDYRRFETEVKDAVVGDEKKP